MNSVAFAALSVMVFIIPWENAVTFQGLGSIARLASIIGLFLCVLDVLVSGKLRRPRIFHMLALTFLLWSVFTTLWTINLETTVEITGSYVMGVALAWLVWQLAQSEVRQLTLLQTYVLGAYVPTLLLLSNYARGTVVGVSSDASRYSAAGINPNEIGMLLVLAIPMAWYLVFSRPGRINIMVNLGYVPLAMLAVILTGSRGAFVSAFASMILIPWSLGAASRRLRIGLSAVLFATMILLSTMVPQDSRERLGQTATRIEEGDFTHREVLWRAAVEVFLEHPLAGVGAGTFAHATQPLGHEMQPHQTFLSVLVGQGLVGLALFLAMFTAALGSMTRTRDLQRKFCIVLALTLLIGLLPRTWDYRRPLWFVLSVLVGQSALVRRREFPAEQSSYVVGSDSLRPCLRAGALIAHYSLGQYADVARRSRR